MDLESQHCLPCEGDTAPLDEMTSKRYLQTLQEGWELDWEKQKVYKTFQFKNFYQTMGFVNAIAWMANLEGHHPDLAVSYNRCQVNFTTHAIHGLSINDFICAAKVDVLFKPYDEKFYGRK